MRQLWEWTATDRFGKSTVYQAHGPDCTEAQMRDHLMRSFINVRFTDIKRLADGQYKPATGMIESHTFSHGHYDRVMSELGYLVKPERPVISRNLIQRRPIVRAGIIIR